MDINDLPFNDEEAAFELAKELHAKNALDPETLTMIIQHMQDPTSLIARLEAEGVTAQPRAAE